MNRVLLLFALLLAAWSGPARAADIPARPKPFTFVNDQANLLNANDAKKLENGLRKYADTYGTQVVLVTVPTLGGTSAADYARQLGTAWGVGQRDKNNGIVVLLSGKERQMSIEAGSGLRSVITPELTRRVITQEMTPAFKQGNYFAGLSKGLGTIMLAANPSSDPRKSQAAATASGATASDATPPSASSSLSDNNASAPAYPTATPEPSSSGIGFGTILIGVLVIGGGIWLVSKLFKRNTASQVGQPNQAPDFYGNRPNSPAPNAGGYPPQGNYGGGYGGQAPSSGSGIGGMLATGAAAAAGAYLGNRLAGDHDSGTSAASSLSNGTAAGFGGGAGSQDANAGSDYFASRNEGSNDAGPDYFSGNDNSDSSDSFFSNDNSYDDASSGDTGGGGFDSTNDDNNSGSW